ncbi:MAG: hypothetical protein NC310_01295 [Roseburia sp.]|nr:hypothetical protein [Anaeroplasma bactoclasticum]MCM1195689.1 hypothetical protein [Roseburia sp.]MCM1556355.1 hypothetical protein [Anaeroplasma bactoclasticum]
MRKYNETEIKLLQFIAEHPSFTIEKMCECLYLGRSTVTKYIRIFKEEKLIYDNGQKKSNYRRLLTNKACLLLTKK